MAAFTTGAAYHLVISEIHVMLGIEVKKRHGFFKIIGVRFNFKKLNSAEF